MRAAAAGLVLLLLPAASAAQQAPEPEGEKGEKDESSLIARGVELRLQNKDADAFEVFSQAWERFQTPRAQAHVGLAAQALGRWALAETHLESALRSDDPWVVGKRKTLEEALAIVRKRLGSLEILADVSGVDLLVDGQPTGKLPLERPLRLPVGTVVLQLQADGYVPVQRSVTIAGGQLGRESFRLVRVAPLPSPARVAQMAVPAPGVSPGLAVSDRITPAAGNGDTRRRRILLGAVGLTAVAGGLATWSGVDTLAARDRYVERPTEAGYRDGLARQRRTNLLLISTGVVAAGALAWALLTSWGGP
jgi:hypothetical protein